MAKHGSSATELLHEFHRYGTPYCDLELNDALDEYYASSFQGFPDADYVPRISDYDFFNMVSVVRPHNFPAIAALGLRTGRDAMGLLYDFGLSSLIYQDAALVEAAKAVGLTPGEYTDIMNAAAYADNDKIIRAFHLHVKLRTGNGRVPGIVLDTLGGHIRYADAEAIGFEKFINRSGGSNDALNTVARALKWRLSKNAFTVDDIKAVYSSKPDATKAVRYNKMASGEIEAVPFEKVVGVSRTARLNIMGLTSSAKAALQVRHPVLLEKMIEGKKYKEILNNDDTIIYMDQLVAAAGDKLSLLPHANEVQSYVEQGVDPDMVIRECALGSTPQRIMALHHGAHSAVTDGWL